MEKQISETGILNNELQQKIKELKIELSDQKEDDDEKLTK